MSVKSIARDKIRALVASLPSLSDGQLLLIDSIVAQFRQPADFSRHPRSELVSDCVLREFGDVLRIHHVFSAEAFTKDKFEFALEKTCNLCCVPAKLAKRGNRGHDITIRDVPFSLKTQADAGIRDNLIHISKFMELGKGEWSDKISDLEGLRDRFFEHMKSYERILTLHRPRNRGALKAPCNGADAQKGSYSDAESALVASAT